MEDGGRGRRMEEEDGGGSGRIGEDGGGWRRMK
jgi:hypothetical protein